MFGIPKYVLFAIITGFLLIISGSIPKEKLDTEQIYAAACYVEVERILPYDYPRRLDIKGLVIQHPQWAIREMRIAMIMFANGELTKNGKEHTDFNRAKYFCDKRAGELLFYEEIRSHFTNTYYARNFLNNFRKQQDFEEEFAELIPDAFPGYEYDFAPFKLFRL